MNILENTLLASAYWQVNKAIAKHINSIEGALLLADLVSKRRYFREKEWLDDHEGFFNTAENLETDLIFTKEKRLKLTKLLVKHNLMKVVRKGIPSKNYYYLNDNMILSVLSQSSGNPAKQSSGNTDDKRSGNPATNKNKSKKNKGNDSTATAKFNETSFFKEEEPKKGTGTGDQKQETQSIPLAQDSILGLTQDEMMTMAELKCFDDKDMSFLAGIVDVAGHDLVGKQPARLVKMRKKALTSKKLQKARPLDQREIQEQYENSLQIEKHLLFVASLPDDRLMWDASGKGRSSQGLGESNYGVTPGLIEMPALYRARVVNQIKIDGENGMLPRYLE